MTSLWVPSIRYRDAITSLRVLSIRYRDAHCTSL